MISDFSLYSRLRTDGTIANEPGEIPDALFALPSTVNWIRALRIICENNNLNFKSAGIFYSTVQVRKNSDRELNTAFEQLLFSLNQIASLKVMSNSENEADIARMAIVAWYYCIYGSASAMIAVADGSFQETHAATANQWDQIFSAKGMAMPPFSDRLSDLLNVTVEDKLSQFKTRGKHSLTKAPTDVGQAWGCINEYLSGTAGWTQWNLEQQVRNKPEFKQLNVGDFRTKAARNIRDTIFRKVSLSFLHQAFRYRGKANYRDAIFLAYGNGVPSLVKGIGDDLLKVSIAFSCMAAGYISKRVGKDIWNAFIEDLEKKRSVSISPKSIWS